MCSMAVRPTRFLTVDAATVATAAPAAPAGTTPASPGTTPGVTTRAPTGLTVSGYGGQPLTGRSLLNGTEA